MAGVEQDTPGHGNVLQGSIEVDEALSGVRGWTDHGSVL